MQVKILSTSDVHGYVRADDFRRPLLNEGLGLTRAATVIAAVEDALAPTDVLVKIENGDFIQGSPLTNYIEKEAPEEALIYRRLTDAVGYDVRILGNHEFNYGRDYLEHAMGDDPKVLNANIVDTVTQRPFIGKPYAVLQKDDLKVGVIGLTTKFIPHWEQPDHIRNLTFLDPVEVARQYINEIRADVDVLILAYHGGFAEDLETGAPLEHQTSENQGYQLLQLQGVDALVTGHQHRELAAVSHNVPTTQPGYRGDHVGEITLELNNAHKIVARKANLIKTAEYAPDPKIETLIGPLQARVDTWLDRAVGHVGDNMQITDHFKARMHNHPFVELVNRVQMEATGTTIANTAIFNDEVRGLSNAVTLRDVMTNYIYPNTLVVESLTGQDIKDALEVNARYFALTTDGKLTINPKFMSPKVQHYNYDIWSGIDYTFDLSQPMNQRVVQVTKDGEPLDMLAEYEVTMNNYRAGGAGNFDMFAVDKIVREVQIDTAELIGDYIMTHPAISIRQPTNLTIIGFDDIADELKK